MTQPRTWNWRPADCRAIQGWPELRVAWQRCLSWLTSEARSTGPLLRQLRRRRARPVGLHLDPVPSHLQGNGELSDGLLLQQGFATCHDHVAHLRGAHAIKHLSHGERKISCFGLYSAQAHVYLVSHQPQRKLHSASRTKTLGRPAVTPSPLDGRKDLRFVRW